MKASYFKSRWFEDEKVIFPAALFLKIAAGLSMAFIYANYFEGGDSELYFTEAQKIYQFSNENDVSLFHFLFNGEGTKALFDQLTFKNQPRALLFNKVVYIFFLLAGGNFWLISIYLSVFSFAGFWIFYKAIKASLKISVKALVVALFFWPSVVFWSSGLVKESISTFLILVLISVVLKIMKNKSAWPLFLFMFILCAYFLFKIKYYYAGILIPILVSFYLCEQLKKVSRDIREKIYLQIVCFLSFFCLMVLLASNLHYNLRLENIAGVIVENYRLFEAKSEPGKMIVFENLVPSFWSFLFHAPKALFSGLFRPNLFDIENVWSALAGIENFILLILTLLQLKNVGTLKKNYILLVLSALFFCGIMAILLSFSAPNLGTLVRYKVGFLPIMLIIILQSNPLFKVKIKSNN